MTIRLVACLCFLLPASTSTAQDAPINREALRYDGKTFDQWRTYLHTELKPKLRVEAIEALTTFATNGYERDATRAIAKIITPGMDTEVALACQRAFHQIGFPAADVLLSERNPTTLQYLQTYMPISLQISGDHTSTLLVMTKTANIVERDLALELLRNHIKRRDIQKVLRTILKKDGEEEFVATVLKWDPTGVYGGLKLLEPLGRANAFVPNILVELRRSSDSGKPAWDLFDRSPDDDNVRLVKFLGQMGPAAKLALDDLSVLARTTSSEKMREAAQDAIALIMAAPSELKVSLVAPAQATLKNRVMYEIRIKNNGFKPLENILVEVSFDREVDGAVDSRELEASIRKLGAMETQSLRLSVLPRETGSLAAKVTARSGGIVGRSNHIVIVAEPRAEKSETIPEPTPPPPPPSSFGRAP